MAILAQKELFGWQEVEAESEQSRLKSVLEILPDEALMASLERQRKGRRDDYPIRAVWNSIIAGIIYQHPSIESWGSANISGKIYAKDNFKHIGSYFLYSYKNV